ncbi:DUF983 domain-containing protein [Putridiphycobacter roseus]|uniref:DUF983 domain-containing protein n=1 Tax=Putridiphycobacter roseus TaxID=2219161 RepID=A0A2W1NHY4_9FLAO|nr:DUF983 domain-containing protein [Putridiphycobacter roseus]PZE17536.1 DUF983 domain-containing protein [Putridiphycobacter roseus]
MKKKSIIKSILQLKCPHCRTGDLFTNPGLFKYSKMLDMPEHCAHCGQKYEIEPGFWIGALWTSYPIIVLIITPFIIAAVTMVNINVWFLAAALVLTMLIFFPLTLRLGRAIWIYIFVRYKND